MANLQNVVLYEGILCRQCVMIWSDCWHRVSSGLKRQERERRSLWHNSQSVCWHKEQECWGVSPGLKCLCVSTGVPAHSWMCTCLTVCVSVCRASLTLLGCVCEQRKSSFIAYHISEGLFKMTSMIKWHVQTTFWATNDFKYSVSTKPGSWSAQNVLKLEIYYYPPVGWETDSMMERENISYHLAF